MLPDQATRLTQPPLGGIFLPEKPAQSEYSHQTFVLELIDQLPAATESARQAKPALEELLVLAEQLKESVNRVNDMRSAIQSYGEQVAGQICRDLPPGDYQFGDNCYWILVDEQGYKRLRGWDAQKPGEVTVWFNCWHLMPPSGSRLAEADDHSQLIRDYCQ